MSRTFHITTFGCQMNEHDSEVIDGLLTERGFSSVKERKDASIVIIKSNGEKSIGKFKYLSKTSLNGFNIGSVIL